jgi:integrase
MKKPPSKSIRGIVKVEADKGKLRLAFPSQLSQSVWGKKQKYIYLGVSDTEQNRALAQAKADAIQADITFERFDPTLVRYNLGSKKFLSPKIEPATCGSIRELWDKYVNYKSAGVKAKTLEEYRAIASLLTKVDISSSLSIREGLLEVTTNHRAKKALLHLSAAHKWGMQHKLVDHNPFEGMYLELPKYLWESDPLPNPFNQDQKQAVLEGFRESRRYSYYYSFVSFLFLTGCRPSEAVGLRWSAIALDFSEIIFNGAIVLVEGKQVRTDSSKNNRKYRHFPVNHELKDLLTSLPRGKNLVFPAPRGGAINYNNFTQRAWATVVEPIKTDTTPYCCRDTFISEQVGKGIPAAIVAKWVDNSIRTIEKHYLGNTQKISPL